MPGIALRPFPARAARHLTPVPAYANVLNALYNLRDSCQVLVLWQEVFGEDMLGNGWGDLMLEATFIGRVAEELFPIDMSVVGEMYTWEDSPINGPIPVAGLCLPWEVAAEEDLLPWQRVAAAAIAENYAVDDWDMGAMGDLAGSGLGVTWLAGDADEVVAALARLAARGEPWDGLANLVQVALQPATGNPFLDWPESFYLAMEYAYHDFYWTAADIEYLARRYDEVRPLAGRIRAFENWYNAQPDRDVADQIVIAILREAGGD